MMGICQSTTETHNKGESMAMIVLTSLLKKEEARETGYFQLYNVQTKRMDLWRVGDGNKVSVVKRNVDKDKVN